MTGIGRASDSGLRYYPCPNHIIIQMIDSLERARRYAQYARLSYFDGLILAQLLSPPKPTAHVPSTSSSSTPLSALPALPALVSSSSATVPTAAPARKKGQPKKILTPEEQATQAALDVGHAEWKAAARDRKDAKAATKANTAAKESLSAASSAPASSSVKWKEKATDQTDGDAPPLRPPRLGRPPDSPGTRTRKEAEREANLQSIEDAKEEERQQAKERNARKSARIQADAAEANQVCEIRPILCSALLSLLLRGAGP